MLTDPLFLIAALACLAVVAVLAMGLGGFARGGEAQAKRSNRLMQWRIGLQALAVGLIVLFIVLRGQTGS